MPTDLTTPQTDGPVEPAPEPTPAPPQPAASPTVPGQDPMVYAPDGKTWKSKYLGADGTRLQVEEARGRERGRYEQQVKDLEQQLREREAEVERLKSEAGALTGQIETIPKLRDELSQFKIAAAEADRLRILMKHPELLAVQVQEEQVIEGQEAPEIVTLNPFMALIENTTLEGELLERELGRLASILPQMKSAGPVAAQPQPGPVIAAAVPQPAAPISSSDADSWRAKAMEWHALKLSGKSGPNGEDPAQMEQEAWEGYYEALAAQ